MQPQLESFEVQSLWAGNHHLAVQHAPPRQSGQERLDELRKIPAEGLPIATLEEQLLSIPKDERAEPIPLGLEQPLGPLGQGGRRLGEHGQHGGSHGEVHVIGAFLEEKQDD